MSIHNPKSFIDRIRRSPGEFFVIHYSCQNLFGDAPGLSPRITSITVVQFETDQKFSFSTHAIAEELHIPKSEVEARFDEVESELLNRFYAFIQNYRGSYWVHWNMRDLTYGFEHLEHRARVLEITNPPVIPPQQRINLNDMLRARYGKLYVNHPQMPTLMDLNGGRPKDFLTGQQEADAFADGDYIKMHQSTVGKIGFFCSVMRKMVKSTLKTVSPSVGARIDRMFETRWMKILGLAGMIASIILGFLSLK